MAAKYFFELGYRQCVFFGSASAAFSRQREEAFRHSLDAKKIHFSAAHIDYTLRPPFEDRMKQAEESVRQWLVELPKPIAVFCSNDEHARMLSSLCQIGGIAVPDEVALLGVDNDETMCLLSSPPLIATATLSDHHAPSLGAGPTWQLLTTPIGRAKLRRA